MNASERPCEHDKGTEPINMTVLEHRLGYRVVKHGGERGDTGQVQNLDAKGHVASVRPASGVEVELYGLLTGK